MEKGRHSGRSRARFGAKTACTTGADDGNFRVASLIAGCHGYAVFKRSSSSCWCVAILPGVMYSRLQQEGHSLGFFFSDILLHVYHQLNLYEQWISLHVYTFHGYMLLSPMGSQEWILFLSRTVLIRFRRYHDGGHGAAAPSLVGCKFLVFVCFPTTERPAASGECDCAEIRTYFQLVSRASRSPSEPPRDDPALCFLIYSCSSTYLRSAWSCTSSDAAA